MAATESTKTERSVAHNGATNNGECSTPNPRDALEVKLDRRIRDALGKGSEDYAPDDWRGLREHLRLPLLYPGQFVAFRDHYDAHDRLVRREVLRASRSWAALQRYLATLGEGEQNSLLVDRVEGEGPVQPE